MTISAVNTIIEERRFPTPPPGTSPSSGPQIYLAPDYPFKGWQPPQPEGFRDSAGTAGESAIILDNGMEIPIPSNEEDDDFDADHSPSTQAQVL
jgi:actin-related protein 5